MKTKLTRRSQIDRFCPFTEVKESQSVSQRHATASAWHTLGRCKMNNNLPTVRAYTAKRDGSDVSVMSEHTEGWN